VLLYGEMKQDPGVIRNRELATNPSCHLDRKGYVVHTDGRPPHQPLYVLPL